MHTSTVRLRITSFGPFLGVVDNPSARIADELLNLHNRPPPPGTGTKQSRSSFTIVSSEKLTVSRRGVDDYFAREIERIHGKGGGCAQQQISGRQQEGMKGDEEDAHHVDAHHVDLYCHLGVYSSGTNRIRVESCAFNEAHFPYSPDASGQTATHEPIDTAAQVGSMLQTTAPIDSVRLQLQGRSDDDAHHDGHSDIPNAIKKCEKQNRAHNALPLCLPLEHELLSITSDPGRYICNYCYYRSLMHCKQCSEYQASRFATTQCCYCSIFIHVLQDEDMNVTVQAQAIFCFLQALCSEMLIQITQSDKE